MPSNDKAAEAAPTTATFTVAKRRTLVHYFDDPKKKPLNLAEGDTIDLPIEEGERLRDLGFFLDENGEAVIDTNGPVTTTGVEIKEV